ncbi:sensor histidine kinase [Litoreibacter sp.]|nr:sensor histidine kinase [Litoreibacter sp.]
MTTRSLRMRLILIILTPLLLISTLAAVWQFQTTTKRAEDIYDRGLLSAALAISRDVALSGGDALSPSTRSLVNNTSGGELFYHVFAPDGVFVTGYATPPATSESLSVNLDTPNFFNAVYQGRNVRVLRFQDAMTVDGLRGLFTVTVWQNTSVRTSFVRTVGYRAIGIIALMFASVAAVVWFGVGLGLRPLLDLQAAIAMRTPSGLEPIRRNVPIEVKGIVSTLNNLLDRVSRRISSKDEFISNAAHQLRNPIAGIMALAEAVESAPNYETSKSRSKELIRAARDATHLTNQLLSFERARGETLIGNKDFLDVSELIHDCLRRLPYKDDQRAVKLLSSPSKVRLKIKGDRVMLEEAILNILTNSIVHGGPGLSRIEITTEQIGQFIEVVIQDDGRGITSDKLDQAMLRFGQTDAGPGSGLGLSIAAQTCENHGGQLTLKSTKTGLRSIMSLPVAETS